MCFTLQLKAQLPMYNSDFRLSRNITSKGELGDSLRIMGIVDRTYRVHGAMVIEYYEMNTAKFLGFAGDTSRFELRRLPYLRRTPMMRRLVQEFGPAIAHDIRQGKFVPGILKKDIQVMRGWPKKRKRQNGHTIWKYDDLVLKFEGQILVQVIQPGA